MVSCSLKCTVFMDCPLQCTGWYSHIYVSSYLTIYQMKAWSHLLVACSLQCTGTPIFMSRYIYFSIYLICITCKHYLLTEMHTPFLYHPFYTPMYFNTHKMFFSFFFHSQLLYTLRIIRGGPPSQTEMRR